MTDKELQFIEERLDYDFNEPRLLRQAFTRKSYSEEGNGAHHNEVLEFYVSGEDIQAVHMLPGFTHNIINLSDTQDLVTVMWANECFDPQKPDTFFEKV